MHQKQPPPNTAVPCPPAGVALSFIAASTDKV
jgi:hypothetical protein